MVDIVDLNNMKIPAIILLFVICLASCATTNQQDCLSHEWQTVGLEDASQGLGSDRFDSRAKACTSEGFSIDKAPYDKGYAQGLIQYCRADTGMEQGTKALDYRGICPAHLEPDFLSGYIEGLDLAFDNLEIDSHEIQNHISRAQIRRIGTTDIDDIKRIDNYIENLVYRNQYINRKRNEISAKMKQWE